MTTEETIDASALERHSHTASWVPVATMRAFMQEQLARGVPLATLLAARNRGDLPNMPAFAYAGVRMVAVSEGRAVCEFEPGEYLSNGFGSVQGGILCTLIDAAIVNAGSSVAPPGMAVPTLELKVNFVRPVPIGAGVIRCEANVEYAGRQTAVIRARVIDASGKLFATASATILFIDSAPARERAEQQNRRGAAPA